MEKNETSDVIGKNQIPMKSQEELCHTGNEHVKDPI